MTTYDNEPTVVSAHPAKIGVWQDLANCLGADPELFFPERGESLASAKAVCAGCVVRLDCLEYALDMSEKFGVWGGLSERERRQLRRTRRTMRRQSEMAAAGRANLTVVRDV